MFANYIFLMLGFGYAFLLPGFLFVEVFCPKLPGIIKIQLYFLISVIFSCFLSYLLGSLFGFNRLTLVVGLVIVIIGSILVIFSKKIELCNLRRHLVALVFMMVVYLLFFISLYPAIFTFLNGHFVMSGPNWQDTAMHMSIIESISQGNFPPQAPYFSGVPLAYYYFADFHSAILNTFFGNFFPKVLAFTNSFFAALFFLSIYNLSIQLTKNSWLSLIAGIIAVFFGNLGFVDFFKDLLTKGDALTLLVRDGYGYEYNGILQMVPVSNYFMQNRPMMFGLPAVASISLFVFKFFEGKDRKFALIVGIIIASLYKFQLFGLVVGVLVILFSTFLHLVTKKINLKESAVFLFLCFSPLLSLYLIFPNPQIGTRNIMEVFGQTFKWGAWQEHSLNWYLKFIVLNFSLGLLFATFSITTKKVYKNIALVCCFLLTAVLFSLPFLMKFTIYDGDMFKFFYYLVIFLAILSTVFISRLPKWLAVPLFFIFVVSSIFTSILNLAWGYLNTNVAYSESEYRVGLWIRENTQNKSVFIEMPTIHSPVADIGGRLRVISYITWPYSHGYNIGVDNVFSRVNDMERLYKQADNETVAKTSKKYSARYVYLGHEEKLHFPEAESKLDSISGVKKIYNWQGISIYEIF